MPRKLTIDEFIRKAREIHGDKYDYSKVEYVNNSTKVCLICPEHGEFLQNPNSHLRGKGCKLCAFQSRTCVLYGVGINDVVDSSDEVANERWRDMLKRCYCEERHIKEPLYKDCYVCTEWHTYSKFRLWFNNPANGYQDGYHLDKDILVKGNKVYSPDTCCFVPQEINKILTRRTRYRGDLPIGVSFKNGHYLAKVSKNGVSKGCGKYSTPEEAFLAYKEAKEQYVKELAEKYYKEGKITERVYLALLNYRVEITD